ncbi:MAG: hypothetical protein RR672_13250, partial [Raoultibacter sp.]
MARQRMIKPEFFDSESLSDCSHGARLAFVGLWVMGDDSGNAKLSFRKLRKQIFPNDEMADTEFAKMLAELESVGCIKVYSVDDQMYLTTANFETYQTVRKPSKTNIPKPPASVEKARKTSVLSQLLTSASPVTEDDRTSDALQHQYDTSTTPVTLKKEVRKEGTSFPYEKEVLLLSSSDALNSDSNSESSNNPVSPQCPDCRSRAVFDVAEKTWRCTSATCL